jgi:hypothetical protein
MFCLVKRVHEMALYRLQACFNSASGHGKPTNGQNMCEFEGNLTRHQADLRKFGAIHARQQGGGVHLEGDLHEVHERN